MRRKVPLVAVLALALAPPAGAEVVDRFPSAFGDDAFQLAGPVLDGDGTLLWGQAVDAAPGEGGRADDFGLGTARDESPGWLLRTAAPGGRPRTLAHPPFPVSGIRQQLDLAAGGGRLAVTAIAFVNDKYEGSVETGGTTQVGPVGGALSPLGCGGPLLAVDATRLVRFGCEVRGTAVEVQDPDRAFTVATRDALKVAAGAGVVAVATYGSDAEPPRVRVTDPRTGATRVALDSGTRSPQLVVGTDGTVVATRERLDGTPAPGLDVLHPDGTRTELAGTVTPLRLHGTRLFGRRAGELGTSLLLLDTSTGVETPLLTLPDDRLISADAGPATIAWARRECDEIVVERAPLDGRPLPVAPPVDCPVLGLHGPNRSSITRGGAVVVKIRCLAACTGSVDLYGSLGVYGRRRIKLPARHGSQRVRIQLNAVGLRRVRQLGSVAMDVRLRVRIAGRPGLVAVPAVVTRRPR